MCRLQTKDISFRNGSYVLFISANSGTSDVERNYDGADDVQENNLAPDSPRLPTLDSLTMNNMIMNEGGSTKTTTDPNWYLLKRFGSEEGKFSTYRPAIQRGGLNHTDTKMQGEKKLIN